MDYLDSTSPERLEQMYKTEKNPKVKQRLLMCIHVKEGKTQREVGKIVKAGHSRVCDWVQRFRKWGIQGLHRKQGSGGHNRKLSKQQEKGIAKRLKTNPMTTKEVLVYIKEHYGQTYHPNAIQRFLKRIDQSLITARPVHKDADPLEEERFRKHIKKGS